MGVSRALLIAAPQPDLEFVRRDLALIRDALIRSGYPESAVTVLDAEEAATDDEIVLALDAFLAECRDDDFALVYFTGHGVRRADADYLVPTKAHPELLRSLIKVAPNELLGKLRSAATVMLCLDACRDEADPDIGTPPRPEASPERRNVVLVQACVAGERAMGTEEGSFMGRALAEALAPDTPWRTVSEVLTHVKHRTEQIARDNGSRHPVDVTWLGSPLGAAPVEPSRREICASGRGTGGWTSAMHDSPLWTRVTGDEVVTGRLKDRISLLIDRVLRIKYDADRRQKAGPDLWEDLQFPERVLVQLDRLVPNGPEGRLSPLEVVVLLAAPFVREAALACSRRALAELYPPAGPGEDEDEHGRPGSGDTYREHLAHDMDDVRRAYRQIDAKRLRLRSAGPGTAAVAAEQWLRHRLPADWDQLWCQSQDGEKSIGALKSMADVLRLMTDVAEYAAFLEITSKPTRRDRLSDALLQVVSQMHTRPGTKAPDGRKWENELTERLALADTTAWRPAQLAGLLHMAELLAIDPRMLDGIVVDHLGDDVTDPATLLAGLDDGGFAPSGDHDWGLVFECPGPALHVALDRQAQSAAAAAQELRDGDRRHPLYARLPRHVGTGGMEPRDESYKSPPPRFQLSEDGVKPLIMGTQLYGDHMLALRELYQNALDACRRRHARQKYTVAVTQESGLRAGRPVNELSTYEVTFVLGRSDDGRVYLECTDNGIGMTEDELDQLFSRAGRRFEQSPQHVRELRRWRRKGVRPELNSRFGIGVFSYFMLAETIEVTTLPANASGFGSVEAGHHVHVTSDSGLMRSSRDWSRERPGTRVRLYLRPEFAESPPSVVRIMREQVWHTPVRLSVQDNLTAPSEPDVWEPGVLKSITPVVPPESPDGPWWVRDKGARLVDGIFVGDDERPHGYVINLCSRHAAELRVDRNRLQRFAADVVRQDLARAVGNLELWNPLPLAWLWKLIADDARTGEMAIRHLLANDARVTFEGWYENTADPSVTVMPLAALGCLPADEKGSRHYVSDDTEEDPDPTHFFHWWRSQLVNAAGPGHRLPAARAGIGHPAGFPAFEPLDGLLFREMPTREWDPMSAALRAAADSGHGLRTVIRALRRYAVIGVPVPEAADIPHLADIEVSSLLVRTFEAYAERHHYGARAEALRPPVHLPLLLVAGRAGKTIQEVAALVRPLRILHPEIPEPPELDELARRIPDQQELAVLDAEHDSDLHGLPAVVTPLVAACFARELGIEPADVVAIARRYERLGFRVSEEASEVRILDGDRSALSPRHFSLTQGLLAYPSIDLLRLVRLSARRGDPTVGFTARSVRETVERLRLRMDDPSGGPLASVKAPSWWARLGPDMEPVDGPLSTWTVLRALRNMPQPESVAEDIEAAEALAAAGVVSAEAAEAVRTWWNTPVQDRPNVLLDDTRMLDFPHSSWQFVASFDSMSNCVDTQFLVVLAAHRGATVGETADLLRREAAPYGIDVAPVPEEARALRPSHGGAWALYVPRVKEWRTKITRREVIALARNRGTGLAEAVSELRTYELLGAPAFPAAPDIPGGEAPSQALDPAVRAPLEELLQFHPLNEGPLTPLALTITAVRLGLGLNATHHALAAYPELGLFADRIAPDDPAPDDDHTPDHLDVVLLTRHLTGSEPVLAGDVTHEHIELAAEETGLDVSEVRRRLAHYAPWFGLRVPAAEAPRTTDTEKEPT
ncbi:caspase family protein [Streptomyces sp. NPDC052299]|uniref:HD domain-containing protein n=1 Tax=Streptomyces sp. NPDC052299 TaxID=3155054 RepID=UPI003430B625